MTQLEAALSRADRFEKELGALDPAMRANLTSAWKELILERAAEVLRATNDPKRLAFLDRNIAVIEELVSTDKPIAGNS